MSISQGDVTHSNFERWRPSLLVLPALVIVWMGWLTLGAVVLGENVPPQIDRPEMMSYSLSLSVPETIGALELIPHDAFEHRVTQRLLQHVEIQFRFPSDSVYRYARATLDHIDERTTIVRLVSYDDFETSRATREATLRVLLSSVITPLRKASPAR